MNSSHTLTEVARPRLVQVPRTQPSQPQITPLPRRRAADWPVVIMVVCSLVLAGAFATYVLAPAARTATAASTTAPIETGP